MHWASISDLATLGMWADPGSYAWYVGGPRYLPPSYIAKVARIRTPGTSVPHVPRFEYTKIGILSPNQTDSDESRFSIDSGTHAHARRWDIGAGTS